MKLLQLRATPPADLVVNRVWRRSQCPLSRFWVDVSAEVERTISLELRNRLDLSPEVNIGFETESTTRRLDSALAQWARIELRDAIDRTLRRQGLPAIGKRFHAHNQSVDLLCQRLLDSGEIPVPATMSQWLRVLAAANLIEAWPGAVPDTSRLRCLLTSPAAAEGPFDLLAKRLHERLLRGAPIGLFTDNHGEVVFDMSFLAWVVGEYAAPVYAFSKSQPVETDCPARAVRTLVRRKHHGSGVRVVATGSCVQGNRLDRLSPQCQELLRQIKAACGVVVAKGIANLDSMIGLKIDTLFVFAAKGERTSSRFGVPRESLCGLWVPAGMPCDHSRCQFVHCPV